MGTFIKADRCLNSRGAVWKEVVLTGSGVPVGITFLLFICTHFLTSPLLRALSLTHQPCRRQHAYILLDLTSAVQVLKAASARCWQIYRPNTEIHG